MRLKLGMSVPEQSSRRSMLPCVGKQLAHEHGWGV
jgi:hypothetical protein